MSKRRLGPGEYEEYRAFKKRFLEFQEEFSRLPEFPSPHTSDYEEDDDDEKSNCSSRSGINTSHQGDGTRDDKEKTGIIIINLF